jgi:hypothetical protein
LFGERTADRNQPLQHCSIGTLQTKDRVRYDAKPDHHFAAILGGFTTVSISVTEATPSNGATIMLPLSINLTLTRAPETSPAAPATSFGRRRPKLLPHLHIFGMMQPPQK